MDLDILKLIDGVHIPVSVHLIELSQIILYHVNLKKQLGLMSI